MKNRVLLAQTDTTVGFLSQDSQQLSRIKERPDTKPFLKVYADLKSYKNSQNRVPRRYKKMLRRAEQTTFVINNRAFRIVKSEPHLSLIKKADWFYSTSANKSGHGFERTFCEESADIIVEDFRGLHEQAPSSIIKLGRSKRRKLR